MTHTFAQLAALAVQLTSAGKLVTQIHCTGDDAPDQWTAPNDGGVHIFSNAEVGQVITSEGESWVPAQEVAA